MSKSSKMYMILSPYALEDSSDKIRAHNNNVA